MSRRIWVDHPRTAGLRPLHPKEEGIRKNPTDADTFVDEVGVGKIRE